MGWSFRRRALKGSVNENVMFMTVLATGLCGA